MRLLALLLLSGTLLCGSPVLAQETAPEGSSPQDLATPSALGVRQQRVIRMMQDLERKFTTLSQTLEKTEPERAERLIKAFQQSKQLLIEDRMASIVKLLNEARLDPASEEQGEIISDLKSLINLLLEDDDWEEKQEDIAQLEAWRERVQELLNKERELRDESDRVSNKDQTLADLQQQIKALEGIIKKQEDLVRATEASRERGVASLGPVADRQHQVRGETEQLADNVGGKSQEDAQVGEGEPGGEQQPGGEKSGGEKSGGQKSAGGEKSGGEKSGQPGGEKSGGEEEKGQPSGGEKSGGEKSGGEKSAGQGGEKSGGEKSGGEKSGGEKSGQSGGEKSGQPGSEKSGGEQSGGKQSGGQQAGEQQSGPSRPGEESLRKAAEHQGKAENELGQGKGEPAQEDQQKALVELNKALEELKQEHSRIAKLPPEMFDELAKEQEKTSRDTGALEDEIAKAKTGGEQGGEQSGGEQSGGEQSGGEQSGGEQSGGEQSGGQQSGGQQSGGQQSGGQQSGGQKPGQEDLKQAKQAMDKAAEDLKKKDPSKAGKNQEEAIEKLKKAIKEIEERLAQLREETQLEKLARLEQRFREMLALQENASKATIELHGKRDEDGKLKRSDRLALAKVAEAERVIAELARLAEEIIIEDGTSVVFPRVTEHLRTDLNGVAGLLDDQRTDKFTQTVQGDIEQTLRELIEALEKAQKQQEGESESGGGGGGGGGMEEPLLPSSAELKLLRSAQLRVNRRTKAIDEARDGKELDNTLRQELEKAAQLQREITELTEEILEKF